MAQFLNDTMTDTGGTAITAHTGETGATWSVINSTPNSIKITSNRAYHGGAQFDLPEVAASGTPAGAEYDIDWTMRVVLLREDTTGVLGRVDTGANSYYSARYYRYTPDVDEEWRISKLVAGVNTLLGTYSQVLTNGQDYVLKFEIRDAAKKLYVDSVERISSADNAVTLAGLVGMRMYADDTPGTGAGFHIDSISATDAAGAATSLPLAPNRMMHLLAR